MAISAGDVLVKIKGDSSDLDNSLKGVDGKINKHAGNWTNRMKKVGMVITGVVAAIGGASLKMAVDFEEAFAGVRKTVDATEEEFAELDKALREMTKELPVTYIELARIAEAAGQLGIAKEDIISFTNTIAKLGMATNMTGDEAATSLARFMNITGMATEDVERLASVIVDLGNNSATTEAEIVDMAMRLAGAGTTIGMTEVQIMAFAAALSSMGLRSEAGGTAFSKTMLEMNSAVAGGGTELKAFASTAGMTTTEFATLFKEDATGAVMSFVSGLGRMKSAGQDITPVLDEVGLSGIRVVDTLLRATGAQELLTDAQKLAAEAWEENSALQEEAAKRIETTASKLQILKNEVALTQAALGDALLPILQKVMAAMIPIINKLTKWIEAHPKLSVALLASVGAMGVMMMMIGPLMKMWAALQAIIHSNTVALVAHKIAMIAHKVASFIAIGVMKLITLAQWAWNAAMNANPIGAIVTLIGLLVTAGILLYKNWDKVVSFFKGAWRKIKLFFLGGVEKVLGILAKFTGWLPGVGDQITALHDKVANMIDAEKIGSDADKAAASFAELERKVREASDDIVIDVEQSTQATIDGATRVADEEKRILDERAGYYRDLTAERIGLIDEQMMAELIAMDPTGEVARLAGEHNKLLGDTKEDGIDRDKGLEEDRVSELKDALKNEYSDRKNELEDQLDDAEGARKDSIEDQLAELKDGKKAREDVIKDQIADIEDAWAEEESGNALHNAIMELDTEGYYADQKTAINEGLAETVTTYNADLLAFQEMNADKLTDTQEFIDEYNRIMGGLGATPDYSFETPTISAPSKEGTITINRLKKMAGGGMITEPTLLYGLKSQKPYAIAGEAGPERVSPSGSGGTSNINISQMVVREDADIYRVARELFRLQQSQSRQVGVG